MAPTRSDASGKQFAAPLNGDAAVYVFRSDKPQPINFGVTAGQKSLGDLASNTWLRADLPPGQYDFRCTGGREGTQSVSIDLRAGEIRYLELGTEWFRVACTLKETAAAAGRAGVMSGQRAQEIR